MSNWFEFLAYMFIYSGNCMSNGYDYIENVTECEIAANSFNYGMVHNYKDKVVSWSSAQYPFGCVSHGTGFIVNVGQTYENPNEFKNCNNEYPDRFTDNQVCICKEK